MPFPFSVIICPAARLATLAILLIGGAATPRAQATEAPAPAPVHPQKPTLLHYMPYVSGGYVVVNMEKVLASPVLQKVMDDIERESGETLADHNLDNLQKVYMGFDAPDANNASPRPPATRSFSIQLGKAGYSADVIKKADRSGATSSTLNGRTVYTSGTALMLPLDALTILETRTESDMQRMFDAATADPATSSAVESAAFQRAHRLAGAHMLTVAVDAEIILQRILPELEKSDAATYYKSGIDALRRMTFLTATIDWDTQPAVHITLHIPARQHASALTDTLNGLLNILRNRVAQHPVYARVLAPLRARTTDDGVELKLEVPTELADQWLEKSFKEFVTKRKAGTLWEPAPRGDR